MASPNERIIYAAKQDSIEMLDEIFTTMPENEFNVNFQDGLGNTALHYAASTPSPSALEALLDHEGTDVDLQNRIEGSTPLHLAVKLENESARLGVVEMLLEAGADPRIKDKKGSIPAEYLNAESIEVDKSIQRLLAIAMAEFAVGLGAGGDDLASDGEEGSGSGSDEE